MNESLSYKFFQIAGFQRNLLEKYMSEIGLHSGQVFVLFSLWDTDGQNQAQLVKNLQVSPPTIYKMVQRLADSGFVELRKADYDARLMRIFLTEKGYHIKPLVQQQWHRLEDFLFSGMSEPEKIMFGLLLQKIGKPL